MIDKASDTEVDYISVIDFNQGKLLLDLVNYPSFSQQTLEFEWFAKADDGTDFELIQNFEIQFTEVDEC